MPTPLHRLADSYVPRFVDTFLRSIHGIQRRATTELITAELARGLTEKPRGLYALLDDLVIAKATAEESTAGVYAELTAEAANFTYAGAFRVQSPHVQEAAQRLTSNLVTAVADETKAAIRQVVYESIRDGVPPAAFKNAAGEWQRGSAAIIRDIVGLTQRDALAVARSALPASEQAAYAAKLLDRRAMTIARTETSRAGILGRQMAWKEQAKDGLIDLGRFNQRWKTSPGPRDRLCELCAPMEGVLVPLDGTFESTERGILPSERVPYAGESVEGPPLHPNCLCDLDADYGEED